MAVGDPSATPPDRDRDQLRRDAIAVLNGHIQAYERYHALKEQMTWLATAAYLGGAVLLVGREPFWRSWPIHWFVAWLVLLLFTAAVAVWFVQWQFGRQHRASAFLDACNDTVAQWLSIGVSQDDLRPERLAEVSSIMVPTRLATAFRRLYQDKPSAPQVLTLVVMLLWTVAAGIYVMLTYKAPCLP